MYIFFFSILSPYPFPFVKAMTSDDLAEAAADISEDGGVILD